MANIPQRDPETAGGGGPNRQGTPGSAEPYADTNRFGTTQTGDATPIPGPRNLVSDEVWGWNDTAGCTQEPATPLIPVTKGE
jgi:hypothetical protein